MCVFIVINVGRGAVRKCGCVIFPQVSLLGLNVAVSWCPCSVKAYPAKSIGLNDRVLNIRFLEFLDVLFTLSPPLCLSTFCPIHTNVKI